MSELNFPTPSEIIEEMLGAGKSPNQIIGGLAMVMRGIEEGEIRTKIGCWENIRAFFEMAQRMYVQNGNMALGDAEIGIHIGSCDSPVCKNLVGSYYGVLRPSSEEDSQQIYKHLQDVAQEIILGKPLPELENQFSGWYDGQTKRRLKVLRAVDITDKCILRDRVKQVNLQYIKDRKGLIVFITQGSDEHSMSRGHRINSDFSPYDKALNIDASLAGIDTEFLYVVMLANAPKIKSKKLLSSG